MQVPLPVTCASCGHSATHKIRIDDTSFDWTCDACGHAHSALLDLEITIGFLLLERSRFELQEQGDFPLSITLAASAFEIDLSRLYIKWTHIAELKAGRDFDGAKCEKELRKLKFIPKLNTVAQMLHPKGIEGFVQDSAQLTATINNRFPSLHIGSLADDFHKAVFKPRNAIVHQGNLHYDKKDAERCYSIASLGLSIFKDMDKAKRIAEQL